MIEEINTNSNFEDAKIPDGVHSFRVLDFRKRGNLYIFPLSYDDGQEGEQVFFGNQMGEFLKCMGCEESKKGIYIFDSDKVIGGSFKATVYREADKKDPSKDYQRMKDFDPVPF